jgi:hypothetical protein
VNPLDDLCRSVGGLLHQDVITAPVKSRTVRKLDHTRFGMGDQCHVLCFVPFVCMVLSRKSALSSVYCNLRT